MSWNYRVLRKPETGGTDLVHEIHEVYYLEDGTIDAWSKDAMNPFGQEVEELRKDLELMTNALAKPVLEERDGRLVEVEG